MTEATAESELMTLDEACRYWRVSKTTGRRIIRDKQITKFTVGSRQNVRYRRKDIEKAVVVT